MLPTIEGASRMITGWLGITDRGNAVVLVDFREFPVFTVAVISLPYIRKPNQVFIWKKFKPSTIAAPAYCHSEY
jgi:hypothetical protein